ncbi:MAG: hypothetical protein L6408_04445 [Nanoarchaeota archaeon]|nr:hypothetical protein [Nanoarchaeota archaeon]
MEGDSLWDITELTEKASESKIPRSFIVAGNNKKAVEMAGKDEKPEEEKK